MFGILLASFRIAGSEKKILLKIRIEYLRLESLIELENYTYVNVNICQRKREIKTWVNQSCDRRNALLVKIRLTCENST